MKILMLGSNGMAGHVVAKYLQQHGHNINTVARNNSNYFLDIE
jgi:nucleoside-diphosphate-sugar epimerase